MREAEFSELAAAHQAELRAHCYRILGSVHDANMYRRSGEEQESENVDQASARPL